MSVATIRATIDCDGCGKQFKVEMDPARRMSEVVPTVDDAAHDAVAGGIVVDMPGSCSVQDDKELCPACTKLADSWCDQCGVRPWTTEASPDRWLCDQCNP